MAKLVSKIKEIWHDRKRFLGMPITLRDTLSARIASSCARVC